MRRQLLLNFLMGVVLTAGLSGCIHFEGPNLRTNAPHGYIALLCSSTEPESALDTVPEFGEAFCVWQLDTCEIVLREIAFPSEPVHVDLKTVTAEIQAGRHWQRDGVHEPIAARTAFQPSSGRRTTTYILKRFDQLTYEVNSRYNLLRALPYQTLLTVLERADEGAVQLPLGGKARPVEVAFAFNVGFIREATLVIPWCNGNGNIVARTEYIFSEKHGAAERCVVTED